MVLAVAYVECGRLAKMKWVLQHHHDGVHPTAVVFLHVTYHEVMNLRKSLKERKAIDVCRQMVVPFYPGGGGKAVQQEFCAMKGKHV